MATKISLDNVVESVSKFEIDFYFFKVRGQADLNARLVFLSIMELDRFYRNPYTEILECLTPDEKSMVLEMDTENATAFLRTKMVKEDFPPIVSVSNSFMRAIAENKAVNVNKLFADVISQARKNQTLSVEFVAESDEDGLSVDKKQMLINEALQLSSIADIADMCFTYYKRDIKEIYASATDSVHYFLELLR